MKRKRSSFDSAEAKQARSSHSPGSEAATASSPAAACPAPTVVIPDDDEEDNDDDIVIDETKSTPKPKAPTFDISRVKTERRTTEVPGFHMECSDDAAPEVPEPVSTPAAETSAAISTREPPSPEQGQVSTTTQTETGVAIKEENEEMKNTAHNQEENGRKDAEVERTEVGTSSLARENARVDANKAAASAASQMEVESAKEGCSASPQGNEARESREGAGSEMEVTESREAEPRTGGDGGKVSAVPPREQVPVENVLIEAQQQQDQLMELMEKTATERDAYQNEVHQLIVKVEDLEQNMLELTQKSVKKEQNHRASQTDDPESEGDSKSLRQQIEQLRKERDALAEEKRQWEEKNKGEGSSRKSPQKERKADEGSCSSQVNVVDDELALQVDFLLRELDQSNVERDELKTKVRS